MIQLLDQLESFELSVWGHPITKTRGYSSRNSAEMGIPLYKQWYLQQIYFQILVEPFDGRNQWQEIRQRHI